MCLDSISGRPSAHTRRNISTIHRVLFRSVVAVASTFMVCSRTEFRYIILLLLFIYLSTENECKFM